MARVGFDPNCTLCATMLTSGLIEENHDYMASFFFKSVRKGVIRIRWENSEKHVMVLISARRRLKFWGFGTLFYAENTSQNTL